MTVEDLQTRLLRYPTYQVGVSCMEESYPDQIHEAQAIVLAEDNYVYFSLEDSMLGYKYNLNAKQLAEGLQKSKGPAMLDADNEQHEVKMVLLYHEAQIIIIG